jgi:DNA polymerase III alpha subunit
MDWNELKQHARLLAAEKGLSKEYTDRLKVEFKEIEKQGANNNWVKWHTEGLKYQANKNGLVLPWLLGMTTVDPLLADHQWIQQTDWPDIDIDFIPAARDPIKEFATRQYGEDKVCSVGTWTTYKFKSAMQDVVRALGQDMKNVLILTKSLPEDVDELKDGGYAKCASCETRHKDHTCPKCGSEEIDGITIGRMFNDYDNLRAFNDANPDIVDMAVRLVGKIRTMGTHAGGLIISSVPLMGNIPMAKIKGKWTSMWTEGRSTQLSKFGFVKWDVLGLKTLQYIYDCCQLIKKTRGYHFDTIPWARQDKENNILGTYEDDKGVSHHIRMDDPEVFKMLNELRTETVFQFETDVQRGILGHGVRDYYDLQVFNAMGHPGPMDMIPDYVARRDDKARKWLKDEHPAVAQMLLETHGTIVYQEQLAALWQKLAGFTAPEAEAARKAVAKKWKDKLKPVKEQWIVGASHTLGKQKAEEWWDKMESFGRYAFNRSHSTAYVMEAYLTAWLKIHFPPEWWAAVMSSCHHDKMVKYMNTARSEGVAFGPINVEDISETFTVDPTTKVVVPGLASVRGIGEAAVAKLRKQGKYTDIDDFVEQNGRDKTVIQRLIHLGAFQKYHPNIMATWKWYQFKYCSGPGIAELKAEIRRMLLEKAGWTEETIKKERQRQIDEYQKLYPKRKKIPAKVLNWQPKPDEGRDAIMALFPEDYSLKERLKFEKEFLGYYWHSPMDLYHHDPKCRIKSCREEKSVMLHCVVERVEICKTKAGKPYARVHVMDGLSSATIFVWNDAYEAYKTRLVDGAGLKLQVEYDRERDSFTLRRNCSITPLYTVAQYEAAMAEATLDEDVVGKELESVA